MATAYGFFPAGHVSGSTYQDTGSGGIIKPAAQRYTYVVGSSLTANLVAEAADPDVRHPGIMVFIGTATPATSAGFIWSKRLGGIMGAIVQVSFNDATDVVSTGHDDAPQAVDTYRLSRCDVIGATAV